MACKNVTGVRIRQVVCVKESQKPGSEDTLVEDDKCESVKPATREVCESHAKCRSPRYIDNIPKKLWTDIQKQIDRRLLKRDVVCQKNFSVTLKKNLLFYTKVISEKKKRCTF